MAKRFTDTEKYKKAFMRGLPGAYKLFWDYLYHDCNHAGIWHVDFQVAQIYLGNDMPVSQETALRLFNETEERIRVISPHKWFIKPFIPFQYNAPLEHLNPANKVHASVLLTLTKEGVVKPHASPLQGARVGAKDKDKDMDMDKDKEKKGSLRGNNGAYTNHKDLCPCAECHANQKGIWAAKKCQYKCEPCGTK